MESDKFYCPPKDLLCFICLKIPVFLFCSISIIFIEIDQLGVWAEV
ncbi:hypothetical protein HanPI659440_Chr16g0623361 [Helianthus annuus]|nr:hypothetical protein HanPI659440_Chr16g0623361 [Helianthus annuus]